MNGFVFIVLPYIAVVIFIVGMVYRISNWAKTPQPGKMTLFPAPPQGGTFLSVVKESFLLPSLFKGDKMLWFISWVFHAALALIILGHLRVFTGIIDTILTGMGVNVDSMSANSGGAAGIIIFATAVFLILRRITIRRVREITNLSDHFAILLILAVIITGNMMRFGEHFDLALTREYFSHLFTFSFAGLVIPESGVFKLHFLLVQILAIYIPFSKILHFGGIFFTQSLIHRS